MSFLLVGAAVVTVGAGVAKAIGGAKRKKAAAEEARKAKAEMEERKSQFEMLDTSNPFMNLENKMEDLTVNTQEAEFVKQQQQQQQANIMGQMKGAAGSSGIAALAQTMASQGALNAQRAGISIGKQEQANQQLERQAASQIQMKEREGDLKSREMKKNKITTLMGMSAADMEAANLKEAQANQQMWSGVDMAAGGVTDYLTGGVKPPTS